jgi:hypothetical protein
MKMAAARYGQLNAFIGFRIIKETLTSAKPDTRWEQH